MGEKINSENSISIQGNGNKLLILNLEFFKKIKSFQLFAFLKKRFFTKKIEIKLDDKYQPTSMKELEKQVDLIISYVLNRKEFEINIFSPKYEVKLKEQSKNLEIKNFYVQLIAEKNEKLSNLSFRMKEFISISVKKKIFHTSDLRLILIGIVERLGFYSNQPQGTTKIDIFNVNKDFACSIHLTKTEVATLDVPFFDLQFSGYNIYDLPYDIRLKKVFPSIIEEFFYQKLDIKDIEKYLYLKIGLG